MTMNNDTKYSYFQCDHSSGWLPNVRRVNLSGVAYCKTEALVDGKWEASSLTIGELRTMIAFGGAEWIEEPRQEGETAIKVVAHKLLTLIERRGFGPDMQITKMWDDVDTTCGLARSLRLQLIAEAGHTGNGITKKGRDLIRSVIDAAPTRRCSLDTLKAGWRKLHHELSKIAMK